jgi:hypothetical protein
MAVVGETRRSLLFADIRAQTWKAAGDVGPDDGNHDGNAGRPERARLNCYERLIS